MRNLVAFPAVLSSLAQCCSRFLVVLLCVAGAPLASAQTTPTPTTSFAPYIFRQQTGAVIPAGGTLIPGTNIDDGAAALTAPFAFSVYDTGIINVLVSTNGNIRFGVSTTSGNDLNNFTLPATGGGTPSVIPDGITLFPYWDDIFPNVAGGGIYQNVIGSAPNRQWVIEWRAAANGNAVNLNFAVVFFEGQNFFEYRYVQTGALAAANGASATVGMQSRNTSIGSTTLFSFNTASITPGLVLRAVRLKNYSVTQETAPTGVLIPDGGTFVAGTAASDAIAQVTVPFAISIYDRDFLANARANVSTNGWLAFDELVGVPAVPNNTALPSEPISRVTVAGGVAALMPYWDGLGDLSGRLSCPSNPRCGGIFTHLTGTAPNRSFFVEWRQPDPGNLALRNFLRAAVVFVEGVPGFRYHYMRVRSSAVDGSDGPDNVTGSGATIGAQNGGNASALFTQFSLNQAVVTQNMILRYTYTRLPQSITFAAVPAKNVGDAPFAVTATSDKGQPVTLSTVTPAVCSVSGATVTLIATAGGTCTIQAAAAASPLPFSDPDAFGSASATLDIPVRGPQNLVFNPPDRIFGSDIGAPILLASTSPAEPGVATTYSSSTSGVCSVTPFIDAGNARAQLNLLAPGTCTITASNAGNASFAPASVTRSFVISRAVLTFTAPVSISLGAGALTLTASSQLVNGVITFATSSTGICSVAPSTSGQAVLTPIALGNCVVTATQTTSPSNVAPTPVAQTIAIVSQTQSITFNQPSNQTLPTLTVPLTASASSGLPVTLASLTPSVCTVSGNTATLVAAGICTIRASQAGNGTFATATPVDRSFSVLPPPPACDVNNPQLDCDSDGMPNGVERELGTSPSAKDNDIFANTDLGRRLFVRQIYRDVLGREGDSAGINFWFAEITAGRQTRTTMIESFLFAPESEGTAVQAARLYFAAFQRSADPAGLTFWTNTVIASGVQSVSQAFATSSEFVARYGSLDNAGFINRMYINVLGRPADAAGTAFWVGQMGAPSNLTRGEVLLQFANSPEYRALIDPSVSVSRLYISMLIRQPDDGGLNFWAGQIRGGTSIRGLIDSFVTSAEYRNRFLP